MLTNSKNIYDVIIIGAGISGLVCSCYLAKAGMKVLIVEQHDKPGGYCTSFKRKDFVFDAAAHSFGSYREGGNFKKILTELGIDKIINIKRINPTDIIITPDFKITFWNDINETISSLISVFPSEKDNIRSFFNFIISINMQEFIKLRNKTLIYVLNSFFNNTNVINAISLPLSGYSGLPPSLMHAFTGISIFKEFLIDGGYYIEEGIQMLPNAFDYFIRQHSGTILYKSLVKKILYKNNRVIGIKLDNGKSFFSKYVVSACDITQTYKKFLGERIADKQIIKKLNTMIPSLSAFILYIGIDKQFKELPPLGTNIWHLPYYDLDKIYYNIERCNFNKADAYCVRASTNKGTMLAYMNAPFKTKLFWENNKKRVATDFLNRIEKVVPDIKKHITYFDAASPYTLYKYTLNYKGAAFGWAYIPSQLFDPDFSYKSSIEGLYLTGHWLTHAMGIPGTAYLGRDTAKLICKDIKI